MSDTPLTDAAEIYVENSRVVSVSFAKSLEKEMNIHRLSAEKFQQDCMAESKKVFVLERQLKAAEKEIAATRGIIENVGLVIDAKKIGESELSLAIELLRISFEQYESSIKKGDK